MGIMRKSKNQRPVAALPGPQAAIYGPNTPLRGPLAAIKGPITPRAAEAHGSHIGTNNTHEG